MNMATIPEALALALRHHREGNLSQAEEIYRAILAAEPKHADATHFLGVIAHQCGKHKIAAKHIRRAIALNSKIPAYFNNLGEVYRALSQPAEAAECYRRALALKPDYAGAHRNLAGSLRELGRIDDAIASYREVLRISPSDAGAVLGELGELLCRQGDWEEAVACFRQATALKPNDPKAHTNLGVALNSMGKSMEAIACYTDPKGSTRWLLQWSLGDADPNGATSDQRVDPLPTQRRFPLYAGRWNCGWIMPRPS